METKPSTLLPRPARPGGAAAAGALCLALLGWACAGETGQPAPAATLLPGGDGGSPPATPADPEEPAPPTIDEPAPTGPAVWSLSLSVPPTPELPRMAEIFVRSGPGLRFVAAEPGAACTAAGKQLTAQPLEDGLLRLVLFSGSNLQRLYSGELCRLTFERTGGGDAAPELLYEDSSFAPSQLHPRPETLTLEPLTEEETR